MSKRSYQLTTDFPGYRAKEEPTKLAPGTLIYPSKNVITNTAGRVQKVSGYALDGDASTTPDNGIQGWHDFDNKNDTRRCLRSGFLTSAANDAKVQFRYKDTSVFPAVISWKTILSSLTSAKFTFAPWYDATELMVLCLGVNGDGNVYEWNGAVATILSSTVNSITIAGAQTVVQSGFYSTRNKQIVVNGTTYTYTGVSGTTFTGITVDPTGEAVGSVLWQLPVTNAISGMSPAGFTSFKPDIIQTDVFNSAYYGQSSLGVSGSSNLFISKVTDFKDCNFTSPIRVVGEGYFKAFNAPIRALVPQQTGASSSTMMIFVGKNGIYKEERSLDSTGANEHLDFYPLRTGRLQGAFSQNCVTRTKNGIIYLANDNVVNEFGQVSNEYVPQLTDLSFSIIDDMSGYNFSGSATYYHKNFIYQSVPSLGIIRAYNMTDPNRQYWEAPIQYPVSGFYVTEDGEFGGHGYGSSESYLLFTGHRFRANPTDDGFIIPAYAYFAPFAHLTHIPGRRIYFPNRTQTKVTEELFVDGFMSVNTILGVGLNFDLDGCVVSKVKFIDGSNAAITCPFSEDGSLGTAPFGSKILGDGLIAPTRPPYFNAVPTYDKYQYRFEQVFFYDEGLDTQWELISWGTDAEPTSEIDTDIRL